MTVEIETGVTDTDNATILCQNVFENGTVTDSGTSTDGASGNALGDQTFDFWTPDAVPGNVTVDCGSPVECDCLGVAAHTLASSGATIEVDGSDDGSIWSLKSALAPTVDDTIMSFFPASSHRYWRIRITGAIASVGVLKLGKRVVMPYGVLSGHTSIDHAQEVTLLHNSSLKGQFIGNRIIKLGAETSINFGLLDTEFVEIDLAEFETKYNEGRSFFYCGSPAQYPKDIGYCWRPARSSTVRPRYEEGGELMNVEIDVQVYIDQ